MEKQSLNRASIDSLLLYEMREGIYKNEKRLPPESILSESLGVSRTMIRDSLAMLEHEGFISRRHGIGTVINKHVLSVITRMDLEVEFTEMVRQAGSEPGIIISGIEQMFCCAEIAAKLKVPIGSPVFRVPRIITADGKRIIYCKDYFSHFLIKDHSYKYSELEKPIFHFLEKYCHIDVYMDLTVVRAVVADGHLAAMLEIPEQTPLLNMDETGYDIDGNPVLYSEEYYVDAVLSHTVLRKKI